MVQQHLRRFLIACRDRLRYSPVRDCAVMARHLARAYLSPSAAARRRAAVDGYQFTWRPSLLRLLSRNVSGGRRSDPPPAPPAAAGPPLPRTVLLKPPAGREKGVLLVYHERDWLRLAQDADACRFVDDRYHLILTASWSPTHYHTLDALTRVFASRVYVQACNRGEIPKLERFHPRIRCLPTLGCDWLHPDLSRPLPRSRRTTDLVMVAGWGPYKRHWHLFQALRQMPAGLSVTMIGQDDGPHTLDRVRAQARLFRVPQHIAFHQNLDVAEVQAHLGAARVAVILSLHEGYCGVVTEAMFADTPIGVLADAHIGSKEYVNPQTGVLLPRSGLAAALTDFLARADTFRPREWAVRNVSCHRSLAVLNEFLRGEAAAAGRPWTTGVAPFCWRPFATLIHPSDVDRLRPAADELVARAPHLFGPGLLFSLPAPPGRVSLVA